MSEKPAAIAGSLVNMRNVGTHKSVALTIHVQEEAAEAIIKAFGWATMANPVPVAIARLNGTPEAEAQEPELQTFTGTVRTRSPGAGPQAQKEPAPLPFPVLYGEGAEGRDESEPQAGPAEQRRDKGVEALSSRKVETEVKRSRAVRQSVLACKESEFWDFLRPKFHGAAVDEVLASQYVRAWCRVSSRAEITPGSEAEHLWNQLLLQYGAWRKRQGKEG